MTRPIHTIALAAAIGATLATASPTAAFVVDGRFLYEDREWDLQGYTGTVQNIPIRHANVEIVNATTQVVLASGSTDVDGFYSLEVTGEILPLNVFARCLTDGENAGYHIRVVDDFQRNFATQSLVLTAAQTHAITTDIEIAHDPVNDLDFGTYLIDDPDGTGVAQAFNILDNAVDFFDWMAQPALMGDLPAAEDFIVFGWAPTSPNEGSNYLYQGVLIASPGMGNDTDGWADTVILHEQGHWFDDVFSRSDNPGGAHFLGDNNQNPKLSYGEGVATFHCGKVREHRATTRTNLDGDPIDDHVSVYADLTIPPPLPDPGGLSFSYDFEHGTLNDGTPFGQIGSANETNVTSALWDLVDGTGSPDESPGIDDDTLTAPHSTTWAIETTYLPSVDPADPITIEDYYLGWFDAGGAGFMQAEIDFIFVTLAGMEFVEDGAEPDDVVAGATVISPLAHGVSAGGGVVINEIDPGVQDAVELYNSGETPVDITGWQLEVYVNGVTQDPTRIYTFPAFTLNSGEVVAVFERGDPLDNGTYRLYAGDVAGAFNMSWFHGGDGACVLRDPAMNTIDFVKWRDQAGVENDTPVPPDATFTGVLDSSLAPNNLGRDANGTDTDDASDFTSIPISNASVNHPAPVHRTIFAEGDVDVFSLTTEAGNRYGFEARGPISATDTRIELLDATGAVLGSNSSADPGVRDARLDFYSSTGGTFYARVSHEGVFTNWGAYDLVAFERPPATIFAGPSSLGADPANRMDLGDDVELRWINAAAYESVQVYRDGALLATLDGDETTYTDVADRGLYLYEVSGTIGGSETPTARDYAYAGEVRCHVGDDFESGAADDWITDGSNWGVTPFAESGTWAFTDSPAGVYQGCPAGDAGCNVNAIAELAPPSRLPPGSVLTFDQICITEVEFDFCIVEISDDGGDSWIELARYDQGSDPAWGDNIADPGDWRSVSLDLSAWEYELVTVRFRLESDQLVELDGWYLDNVAINEEGCIPVAVNDGAPAVSALKMFSPRPNPTAAGSLIAFALPRASATAELTIFDVSGRMLRRAELANLDAGVHEWRWDGLDARGRAVAPGMYFVRLSTGSHVVKTKLTRL